MRKEDFPIWHNKVVERRAIDAGMAWKEVMPKVIKHKRGLEKQYRRFLERSTSELDEKTMVLKNNALHDLLEMTPRQVANLVRINYVKDRTTHHDQDWFLTIEEQMHLLPHIISGMRKAR